MAVMFLFSVNLTAQKKEKGKESFLKEMNEKSKVPDWKKDGKLFSYDKSGAKAKELAIEDFMPIELPYEQVHVYSEEYSIIIYDEWYEEYYEVTLHGVPLNFTLTEETTISITAVNMEWGIINCFLLYKDGISVQDIITYSVDDMEFALNLLPGDYYLFLHDVGYYEYFGEYLECKILIDKTNIIDYRDVDYSTFISKENPVVKTMNRSTPVVVFDYDDGYVEMVRGIGFSANVESGKDYLFKFDFFTPFVYPYQIGVLFVLDGDLAEEDFEDNILAGDGCYGSMTSEFSGSVYFQAKKTETVKLFFATLVCFSDIFVKITMEETEGANLYPVSLIEMLEQTEKRIVYTDNLFFFDSGTLGDENSFLVKGQSGLFGWTNEVFYAIPYKISLEKGDFIEIHFHHSDDAFLYLYKKTTTGYELIDYDDDGYDYSLDSYIYYYASQAGDFYIVGSTYEEMSLGNYTTKVWNLEEEICLLITNIYANKSEIYVHEDATDNDILLKLMDLEITVDTNYENSFKIPNNPFRWTIASNRRSASYIPLSNDYELDEGVSLVIKINFGSGIENFEKTPSVLVYTNDKTIYIKNTTGETNVSLFDITGRMIKSGKTVDSYYTIAVEKTGIYIVRVGNKAYKVVVR